MRSAILMLACSDYEAMEVSLACHGAYMPPDTQFFILQNCRGTYDSERTLQAARRFERLYPRQVTVVDDIPPGPPYHSIGNLLSSDRFRDIDLVCKVDDDAFPITPGWYEKLLDTYKKEIEKNKNLAYVTPLINNNTWGFLETLEVLGLKDEYFKTVATEHRVGSGALFNPYRILPANEIYTGCNGTIWGAPHIARWLHERTTLAPDNYISATKDLGDKEVPSSERYSIGCILFKKDLWPAINDGGTDDEHMFHQYCRKNNARIVCTRSVPFVHFAYFSQRDENRDIVPTARALYEKRLNLPWPIALRASRDLEIEARLRWIEGSGLLSGAPTGIQANHSLGGLSPEDFATQAAKGLIRKVLRKLKLRS